MREQAPSPAGPEHALAVNNLLRELPGVGTVEVDNIYAKNPTWRRLPLRSYPWLALSPDHLVEAAASAARKPQMLPPLGYEPLRNRLAVDLTHELGMHIDPAVVAVTNGAQAALQLIWFLLLNLGNDVVVPTPSYYAEGAIRIAGGIFKPVRTVSETSVGWDRVEAAIRPSTRALYLTNPNNPVGYLLKPPDIAILERILETNAKLWLVVDESYERIRHDGRAHLPVWTSALLRDRSIMIRSFSKSYALTWLRVGWLAAPAGLMPLLLKVIEWQQLYGSFLNQSIALAALEGDKQWLEPAFRGFTEGRDFLYATLTRIAGCRVGLPEAGPFLFPDIGGLRGNSGDTIATLRRRGIPAIEGRYFGMAGDHFRMPVGGDAKTLSEAASIVTATLAG